MERTSKETVLKKIRAALLNSTPNPYSDVDLEKNVYAESDEPDEVLFAESLTKVGGNFVYCLDYPELVENIYALLKMNDWGTPVCRDEIVKEILEAGNIEYVQDEKSLLKAKVAITGCEYLIARLGSVMCSSKQLSGRKMFVYPEVHIVIGYTSQLVHDLKDALSAIKTKYDNKLPSFVTVITGPSRTADIEKTLVMGAHGPKQLIVFLVEDSETN